MIGNEDMHLKNFSVIRRDLKVELSPAYDLLNSTIILDSREELALPLNGRKNRLKKNDFFGYLGEERLALTQKSIEQTKSQIIDAVPKWMDFIQKCFLSDTMKTKYTSLLRGRLNKLDLI